MFGQIRWGLNAIFAAYKWMLVGSILYFLFLCLLVKLTDKKTTTSYRLKQCLVFSAFFIIPFLLVPVLAWRPKNLKNLRICGYLISLVGNVVDITFEVRDSEILKNNGPAILVANHQSELDALGLSFLYRILPRYTTVTKKEMFYIIPFGIAAWTFGLIPIDRKSKKSAAATLARCKRTLHDENAKILMFAEGTRNRTNDGLLPFKTGAFRLAIEAQVPIIPMVFSPYYFVDRKANTVEPGHSVLQVLDPIPTNGLTLADMNDLMEKTRNAMVVEYGKLEAEVAVNLENLDWKCANRPIFKETTTCKKRF